MSEPMGGDWHGEAEDHVVQPLPDAVAQFNRMLKLCEQPSSRVRFRFGEGYWEETSGPELLKRLEKNRSGRLKIDWVRGFEA